MEFTRSKKILFGILLVIMSIITIPNANASDGSSTTNWDNAFGWHNNGDGEMWSDGNGCTWHHHSRTFKVLGMAVYTQDDVWTFVGC